MTTESISQHKKGQPASIEDISPGEKGHIGGHAEYQGIDTELVQPGADEVYEKKIGIMNEALIDLGMRRFQWKVYATTGFGWFVDNVRLPMVTRESIITIQ